MYVLLETQTALCIFFLEGEGGFVLKDRKSQGVVAHLRDRSVMGSHNKVREETA